MATSTITMGRGLFATPTVAHLGGTHGHLGWITGAIPTSGAISGDDALAVLLKLLLSTGTGDNDSGAGTNYDVFEVGAGLGIPHQRVDKTGIEAIRSQFDYDTSLDFVLFSRGGIPAKKTLENELCRPLGMSLVLTNAGVITVKRPKNPEKFYVSNANQTLSFKLPTTSTEYDATLNVGVYNPTEMATEVARALNATATANWECDYNDSSNQSIRIRNTGDSWDLIYDAGSDQAWQTLGYDTGVVGTASGTWLTADNTTAVFSGTTLTEDDMWDVRQLDSRGAQITSVLYKYDWVPDGTVSVGRTTGKGDLFQSESYRRQRWYISAEDVNLNDPLASGVYTIESKGLMSSQSPWSMWTEPASGCAPELQEPTGVADGDGMIQLVSAHLLDRYRQPPIMFSAKLPWKHNDIELLDQVQVTYSKAGVFIDRELNADTLTTRTFDVTWCKPNYRRGYIECTFTGHRSPTTTSVSVTARGA